MRDLILLLTAICIALIAGEEVFAQDSSGVTCEMRLYSCWGTTMDLAIQGDYAYIVSRTGFHNNIHILNISDPHRPIDIGIASLPEGSGLPYWITVHNRMLFITCLDGLLIYNIEGPRNPVLLSFYTEESGTGAAFVWDDNIAYGTQDSTMTILDISDPAAPRRIGFYDAQFPITSIKVAGNRAYLTGDEFQILDMADIEDPVRLARYDQTAFDCEIIENTAILATGEDGVKFLDISNIREIQDLGHYETTAWKLQVKDSYLFISYDVYPEGRTHTITMLDISDPTNPEYIRHLLPQWDQIREQGDGVNSFVVEGDYLYSVGSGINVWDISDPQNVSNVGCCFHTPRLENITLSQHQLFLGYRNEYRQLNLENPASPIFISRFGLYDCAGKLSSDLNYLFADQCNRRQIQIFDIEDQENIEEVSRYTVPNSRSYIKVIPEDQNFYIAEYSGFSIVDFERNWDPREISYLQTGRVNHITIMGNHAYLSGGAAGVIIVDISDLENPVEISRIATNGYVNATAINGNNLLIIDHDLRIYDVSDPESPQEISLVEIPGYTNDIKMFGNTAFIALSSGGGDVTGGIFLIDISDVENPQKIGFYQATEGSKQIEISPPYVFSNESLSLAIYDFSQALAVGNDSNPNLVPTSNLLNAYPNPFNASTTINYGIQFSGDLSLQVYNPIGQQVISLFDGYAQSGVYSINLTAEDIPTGLYFLRLKASDRIVTQKLILMK